jgi:calcineurin-like phosphoesterase
VVIANGENVAGGRGLTHRTARELFDTGVDIISSGNHIWDQKEVLELPTARADHPAREPSTGLAGQGWVTHKGLTVPTPGPHLHASDRLPLPHRGRRPGRDGDGTPVLVDFHAEATSEKVAMGWYLDGRVAAVCGTHTRAHGRPALPPRARLSPTPA